MVSVHMLQNGDHYPLIMTINVSLHTWQLHEFDVLCIPNGWLLLGEIFMDFLTLPSCQTKVKNNTEATWWLNTKHNVHSIDITVRL